MAETLHEQLIRTYLQKDDAAFDTVIQRMLNGEQLMPIALERHVEDWLDANEINDRNDVRWGKFPLGMVQLWIERAEKAEAELRK